MPKAKKGEAYQPAFTIGGKSFLDSVPVKEIISGVKGKSHRRRTSPIFREAVTFVSNTRKAIIGQRDGDYGTSSGGTVRIKGGDVTVVTGKYEEGDTLHLLRSLAPSFPLKPADNVVSLARMITNSKSKVRKVKEPTWQQTHVQPLNIRRGSTHVTGVSHDATRPFFFERVNREGLARMAQIVREVQEKLAKKPGR